MESIKTFENATKRSRIGTKKGYLIGKRIFDITMSLIALIVLSPVFFVTAVAIWIEDRGPAVYIQKRIGQNEKIFNIYKFRSMRTDAEQIHEQMKKDYGDTEVSFKLKDDPRVTKVGKIIRKFNIDELPQLLNILTGDMSIVGPRPLPVYEYEEEKIRYGDKYALRYSVPQGLTCIWQICNRADVSFEERMQMDVEYTKTCNAGMDITLIVKTAIFAAIGKAEY